MKFIIIGKNIDVTPGLREAVESKLGKLGRYFTPNTEIHVTLSVQKGHQKIEVTIPVKGGLVRSEQESSDMYVSIDLVEEVIERQLRKYKNKLVAREQEAVTSNRNSLTPKIILKVTARLKSYVPKNSDLNLCIRKMRVFRWNFSDMISMFSVMQNQTK